MTSILQLRQWAMKPVTRQYQSLSEALSEIKFIQYDPIKSPLSAQDLILFQRVKGYKPSDLEAVYPNSEFEEDYLHVYGVLSKQIATLLQPRRHYRKTSTLYQPSGLAADVLAFVRDRENVLPKDLVSALGQGSVINAWGGKSAATTRALEELHYYGHLRVSRRMNSNKVYALARPVTHDVSDEKRLEILIQLMVELLAPVSEAGLKRALGQLRSYSGHLGNSNATLKTLLASGAIESQKVEGVLYYLPVGMPSLQQDFTDEQVRFLAPFDPVVWDRTRFEHLWGWAYRFEAYTPQHARRFGYYALPMFYGNQAVGWVNISKNKNGSIDIERGFAKPNRLGVEFEHTYAQEVERFVAVLGVKTK